MSNAMAQSRMEWRDVKAQGDQQNTQEILNTLGEEQPTEKLDWPIFCGSSEKQKTENIWRYRLDTVRVKWPSSSQHSCHRIPCFVDTFQQHKAKSPFSCLWTHCVVLFVFLCFPPSQGERENKTKQNISLLWCQATKVNCTSYSTGWKRGLKNTESAKVKPREDSSISSQSKARATDCTGSYLWGSWGQQ